MAVVDGRVDVVVVSESAAVRGTLVRMLERDGRFDVVAQGRGGHAVALASILEPAVLVLDVSTPGAQGIELLPRILERSPSTKTIVLSEPASPAARSTAWRLGAADVMEKGTSIVRLPARLARLGAPAATEATTAVGQEGPFREVPGTDAATASRIELVHALFERAAIGMATMTLSGSVVRVNRALCAMLGVDVPALVGRRYGEVGGAETAPLLDDAIRALQSGREEVLAVEHGSLRGPERWLRSTIASVRDADRRPLCLFAQVEDLTDRRLALEELRWSEERFRLLVEEAREYAIFTLDPAGRVARWNGGAERMTGYSAEEILGRHVRIFHEPDARADLQPERGLGVAVSNGRHEEEGWRVRKDGTTFWATVVITARVDRHGALAGFTAVARDVTERRLATRARAELAGELEVANARLAAGAQEVADFVAMTAHELRSPIAVVTGAATVLGDHWDVLSDAERRDTLTSIARGGARLHRLIEDLLTVSWIEAGSFEFSLEDLLLRRVLDDACAEQADALGAVALSCPERLVVRADHLRCAQIMTNLLSNAAIHGVPPVDVAVQIATAEGRAEVRVHDAGGGPPIEIAEQLFAKFARGTGRRRRGTGLGLYIVRALARGQGGDAWFEPALHGGGSFCVSLPLA